jgi:16S rRNA (uracil1498-N3)-methyltransferase
MIPLRYGTFPFFLETGYNTFNMHRFFIEKVHGNAAEITDIDTLHHIRDVLRLKKGNEVVIFDATGQEYKGVITAIDKKQIVLKLSPLNTRSSKNINLTIACALPKGSKMDDIIDFLAQLGVECIIPMRTDRVVVKLDESNRETRLKRWQKIARSAAQQSQRSSIPVISPVTDVKDVISNSGGFDLKLITHLSGKRTLIKDILPKSTPKNIIALIGPEGDFTPEEVSLALHNGFTPVSLGNTVLRVATAAIAVAGYLRFATDK